MATATTYTVGMNNTTSTPWFFCFSRKKPNYLVQGDVVLNWHVVPVSPYTQLSFSFDESYDACLKKSVTAGQTNFSGGTVIPAGLGSYFTVNPDPQWGPTLTGPQPPPSPVDPASIVVFNSTPDTQCIGVGINGVAIGYQTNSQINANQSFQFQLDMYCYCANQPVKIGDIITNQATIPLQTATSFPTNMVPGVNTVMFTLNSSNVIEVSYPASALASLKDASKHVNLTRAAKAHKN